MSDKHFTFVRPETQLPGYLKRCCSDLRKFGFCLVEHGWLSEQIGGNVDTGAQLQQFQEALRWISIERDQNLLIDDTAVPPNLLVALAPKNHPGTEPEEYKADDDGKGLIDKEPVAAPDPTGPQLDIDAKFNT